MPAVSSQQQKWAFGVKGPAWAKKHHFDNKGPLPFHVGDKVEPGHPDRTKAAQANARAAARRVRRKKRHASR